MFKSNIFPKGYTSKSSYLKPNTVISFLCYNYWFEGLLISPWVVEEIGWHLFTYSRKISFPASFLLPPSCKDKFSWQFYFSTYMSLNILLFELLHWWILKMSQLYVLANRLSGITKMDVQTGSSLSRCCRGHQLYFAVFLPNFVILTSSSPLPLSLLCWLLSINHGCE